MESQLAGRIARAFAVLFFMVTAVVAQDKATLWGKLQPGPHQVGYKTFFKYDDSRTYDPSFGTKPPGAKGRPIQISLWYPAKPDRQSEQMPFAAYVDLLSLEEEFGTLDEARKREAVNIFITHLRWWTNQTASKESIGQLTRLNTFAYKDAVPEPGKFPLILLAQGAHQSSLYHSILCEYLASQGYIVATSPSMGMTSRLMSTDVRGGETQGRDLEYILAFMRDQPFVDREKLGVTAFSFGGIGGSLVQMRNSRVQAVLSLDSVIGYERLNPLIKQSPYFDIVRANVPYMHLMPQEGTGFDLKFLESLKYAQTYVLRFKGLAHFDFSSLGVIANHVFSAPPDQMERIELGQEIICRYALNFFDAYLKSDPQSLAFLQRKPDDNGIPAGFVVLASSKPPLKAIPTAEQLANMIATNGTWNAIEILRDVKKSDPNSDLLQERALNSLGYRLIFIGKLSEAIEVFKLNVDMYPQSFNVYDSLAEAYMIDGEKQLAIKNYERSLELNPNNTNATEKLKTLR